jgi:dipeptidase D
MHSRRTPTEPDMTSALANLQPESLWKHFDKLSAIPRASTKEAAAREYVRSVANRCRLEPIQDHSGNLIVRKPAHPGRESTPTTLLQAHLDMVCEKNEGTAHNFDTDPIQLLRDGDWLKADRTTLGADNGIGVAAALAVMESKDLAHGPLEFAFTIDEETGMTGASEFEPGLLKSRYYLNLDNEEIGTLCIGCAGGLNTTARRKLTLIPPSGDSAFRIKVSGLHGGHSGVDIHLGRGNAIRILGAVLLDLLDRLPLELASLNGGSAHNAIPREAVAVVVLPAARQNELQSLLASAEAAHKADLGAFDPDLQIAATKTEGPSKVFTAADAKNIAALLVSLPHGVLSMSPDVPGLVQTSTNIATVTTQDDLLTIVTSQRSAIATSKEAAARRVAAVARLAGFEVQHDSRYPGWKPEPHSELVEKMQAAHQKLFGQPATLIAMHAGLECGVIGEKYPGMQMISFGPTIRYPHSPNERVQISTVQAFWNYLTLVLESL